MTPVRPTPEAGDVETVVRLRGVSKRFGSKWAVNGLDLEVHRGELFGFLGPNGAGKSTTMFMIAGLVRPTGGSIRLFGRPPSDLNGARAKMGALIETPAFIPYMTARKNLEMLGRLNGLFDRRAMAEALERVGLGDSADRKVGVFSQGMRQRLGVAQAIQHKPELLVLDEPTNGLDPEGSMDIWRLLREITGDRRVTIMVSSHLLHEIEEHCAHVCVLDHGKAVAQGRVADLLADPQPTVEITFENAEMATQAAGWMAEQPWIVSVDTRREQGLPAGASLQVRVAQADAARLNAALLQAGFPPVYLAPVKRGLRDFFLQMTR